MKNIMVPTDFSAPACNAFQFALDIALKSQSTVHLVHAIELPVGRDTLMMPMLDLEAEFIKDSETKVEEMFRLLNKKYNLENIDVRTKVVFGPITRKILEYSDAQPIDLIIIGSHGSEGICEVLIGSNAEKMVRNAHVPVLIIKDFYKGLIKKIAVPIALDEDDYDEFAERVKKLQSMFGGHLYFVRINTPFNFSSDEKALAEMNAFTVRYGFENFSISTYNAIDIESGVMQYATSIKANLIAMETHGRTGLSRFLTRSITEKVVNHYKGLLWTYSLRNKSVHV